MLPANFPPWEAVLPADAALDLAAQYVEVMAHDLLEILRLYPRRKVQPSAAILDSRTLRSYHESGARAGDDGATCKNGSKIHIAVDTLGHLPAAHITPLTAQVLA